MKVKFKKKHENVAIPTYATSGSAGFDLAIDSFIKQWTYNIYAYDQNIPYPIDEFGNIPPSLIEDFTNKNSINLYSKDRLLVGTGLFVELPVGWEIQIRPRSGNALKLGLTVLNSPGTIDSDYRGEIGVILINNSYNTIKLEKGMKIAQGVLAQAEQIEWEEIEVLSDTDRGMGGYGSTGN